MPRTDPLILKQESRITNFSLVHNMGAGRPFVDTAKTLDARSIHGVCSITKQ